MNNEELAKKVQSGEWSLMDQLWNQCYGFIRRQAGKWARAWEGRSDFDIDDLMQSGYIALCEAVKGFSEEKGYSFISYLAFHLKTEFARCAGCRTPAQAKEPLNHSVSLDSPAYGSEDSSTTVGETIPVSDQGMEEVEEKLFNQQLAEVLHQALGDLPDKQRRVIEMHYLHRLTYIQIADILHCANSYPGQLEKDGLKRLRSGKYAPSLSEMYCGDRNYYKHTGYCAWKYSGISSPERELLRKEKDMWLKNIRYCVSELGMTMEQAQRMFPL